MTSQPQVAFPEDNMSLEIEKDQMTHVCEVVAKKIGRALLVDIKHIADDIRQQYKDHNHLLAKQELVVQQLLGQVHRLSNHIPRKMHLAKGGNSRSAGCGPWKLRTEICAEPETTASDDYLIDQFHTSHGTSMVTQMHGVSGYDDYNGHVGETAAPRSPRVIPRTMSPRPSPAPPLPHAHPHPSPPNSKENTANDDVAQVPAGDANARATEAGLTPCSGDEDVDFPCADAELDLQDNYTSMCSQDALRDPARASGETFPTAASRGTTVSTARKGSQYNSVREASYRGSVKPMFGESAAPSKQNLEEPNYNVCNFYHETGLSQRIARSEIFANITLGVIGANAIYIGVDADNNPAKVLADADTGFQVCENLFCIFFTFEWMARFGAFRRKRDGLKDAWFRFDSALVLMMVVETWIVPIAFAGSGGTGIPTGLVKMLRLLRLARMARLMRAFPELVAMIKGVKVASRAVGSALLMLVLLVYIFAIVLHTLLKDDPDDLVHERFHRLTLCMWTLLIDGTFLDGIGLVTRALIDIEEFLPLTVLMLFVLSSALTVMNMLIGVLCEVVSAVAASEKEDNAIRIVKDKLLYMLREMDEDGSGMISKDEIGKVLDDPSALSTLESLKVDVKFLMDQLDMHFEECPELTIHTIMDLILMLRGDRPPTMKDMLESLLFNRWKMGQGFRMFDESGLDRGSQSVNPFCGPSDAKQAQRLKSIMNQRRSHAPPALRADSCAI